MKSAPGKKAAVARARTSAPAKRAVAKSKAPKSVASQPPPKSSSKSGAKSAAKSAAAKGRASAGTAPLATIPTDCTIAQANDLKADLARVLAKPAVVTLDLSAVRRVDTAALQVLTSFIRERRAAGRGVECQGASDAFLATADVLGLRALFSPVTDDRIAEGVAGNA
jgi:ABC-type transporter Mla MlaB component